MTQSGAQNVALPSEAETDGSWFPPQPNHTFDDVIGMQPIKEKLYYR